MSECQENTRYKRNFIGCEYRESRTGKRVRLDRGKGTYETYGDVAIEKSALELQGVDASEELSIKDVEMPKKRGRKKKADTFPG